MRTLSLHEEGYFCYIDRFDLNGFYGGRYQELPPGVMFLFLIANAPDFKFEDASARETGNDLWEPPAILCFDKTQNIEYLQDIHKLAQKFMELNLGMWTIRGVCQGTEAEFSGTTFASVVNVMYKKTVMFDPAPFLTMVEKETFRYRKS